MWTCRYIHYLPHINFLHKKSSSIIFLSKEIIVLRKKALENIRHAQEKQTRNKEHCKDKQKYTGGTFVLVRNSNKLLRKGLKLEPDWSGPYVIHEDLRKGTYRLHDPGNPSKVLAQKYNMARLKLYYQRAEVKDHCKLKLETACLKLPLTS